MVTTALVERTHCHIIRFVLAATPSMLRIAELFKMKGLQRRSPQDDVWEVNPAAVDHVIGRIRDSHLVSAIRESCYPLTVAGRDENHAIRGAWQSFQERLVLRYFANAEPPIYVIPPKIVLDINSPDLAGSLMQMYRKGMLSYASFSDGKLYYLRLLNKKPADPDLETIGFSIEELKEYIEDFMVIYNAKLQYGEVRLYHNPADLFADLAKGLKERVRYKNKDKFTYEKESENDRLNYLLKLMEEGRFRISRREDAYTVLGFPIAEGLRPNTSITKRYRELMRMFHPDPNGNSPESNRFSRLIGEAYLKLEELGDVKIGIKS